MPTNLIKKLFKEFIKEKDCLENTFKNYKYIHLLFTINISNKNHMIQKKIVVVKNLLKTCYFFIYIYTFIDIRET